VSVAAQLQGMHTIALALLYVNAGLYAVLWLCTLLRMLKYWDRFTADMQDYGRVMGFFATVAGTCVLGNELVIVVDFPRAAMCLWLLGLMLWAGITYSIFTLLTIKPDKPSLADGLHGGWLLAVVAPQSVSVLGAL